jgi:hypothetical protein
MAKDGYYVFHNNKSDSRLKYVITFRSVVLKLYQNISSPSKKVGINISLAFWVSKIIRSNQIFNLLFTHESATEK